MTVPILHSSRPLAPSSTAPANAEEHLLLTLSQTAQALSISKRTLNRLIAGGTFPAPLKIGRASRVAREDIAGYLETLRRERGDKLGTS